MFVLPLARASRIPVSPAFGSTVDRLFDESFNRYFNDVKKSAVTRTPAMDVLESDSAYTVVFDVAGASREQLKVSVEGRRVMLSTAAAAVEAGAQPQTDAPAADAKPNDRVIYREREPAAYARTVVLPAEVDQAASQAKFDNGVLTLTLAKKVPAGATQLNIG